MRTRWGAIVAGVVVIASGAVACSDTAPARAQLVIVIDTDAHVVGELASRPEVSPDSTIDTLRIDVLNDQNKEVDIRTFVVADQASWPLSFGVEPSSSFGGEVRVWIRGFRALFASSGTAANGSATLDPLSQVTIDRLVAVPFPSSGIQHVNVTLRADCMGTPSNFGSPLSTCIDANQPNGDARTGIDVSSGSATPPSTVGTWVPALEVPCNATPSSSSQEVCIPGGFFVLGDLDAVGFGATTAYETVPLRPVIVSPFLLDQYEFTVGKFRTLVNSGGFSGAMPTPATPTDSYNQFCTWLGATDGTNDSLPLNCVPYATAETVCNMAAGGSGHGSLPTEAQWEYAARGRGERLRYPWGSTDPQCCSASLSRVGPPGVPVECPGTGLEPVGSHPLSASCAGMGDVTRDGVFDMAGSVGEVLGDDEQAYTAPCWSTQAILRDPVCMASNAFFGTRGSDWNAGFATAFLPLRLDLASTDGVPTNGFRCAYEDTAP